MGLGHVEKTNDRDYEVEERCEAMKRKEAAFLWNSVLTHAFTLAGDSVQWNQQQLDYKRKRKGIWTHYEVGNQINSCNEECMFGTDLADGNPWSAAMTASQMRIAETIDAFYGDAGANDGVSRSYKQAVEDLDAETIKALDGPFR